MQKKLHCGGVAFQHFTLYLSLFTNFAFSQSFDYADALSKSLLYFEAQRSGHLPYNQRVTWRSHSGLTDGLEQGVDLVGGYYDAGDNVKFGLPMAFTITLLSWSVIEYHKHITDAGEFEHALEAIKWGTDYFIKAHTSPNELWVEVGDGYTDHYCWQRPEDMTTCRQAYKIDKDNPGSDVAGETAAAMAAASIVFKKINPHYSHLLLHHAQQLFDFADTYRGKYDESVGVAKRYYESVSGYKDELLWGGLWLYKATDNEEYLNYVIENSDDYGGTNWAVAEFTWDIKYAGTQVLASKFLLEEKHKQHTHILEEYRANAEYFVCACLNNNNATYPNINHTQGGLIYIRQWNNMQYVTSASLLLTIYADYLKKSNRNLTCKGELVNHQEILSFVKSQADYILGNNPMNISYLVGYNPPWNKGSSLESGTLSYPRNIHHRSSSIVSYKENNEFIGCTQGYDYWYNNEAPNPNVVVGAIVGGPDGQDGFRDERSNFMQTEACTYNTAPMVGVFAKMNHLYSPSLRASY